MFYGELDQAGTLTYVNAGHPPPVFVSAAGESCSLISGGAVLGPLVDVSYERGFATLSEGDLCILYSDGIVEAAPASGDGPDEEFGVARLVEVSRSHLGQSATQIVQAIFSAVERHCGTDRLDDDRTVVVVKRTQVDDD